MILLDTLYLINQHDDHCFLFQFKRKQLDKANQKSNENKVIE